MKAKEKDFDTVKMAREIKEKIGKEIDGMSFEELRRYIDSRISKKKSKNPKQQPA